MVDKGVPQVSILDPLFFAFIYFNMHIMFVNTVMYFLADYIMFYVSVPTTKLQAADLPV